MESWIGQAVQKNNFIADPVVTEKKNSIETYIFSGGIREGDGSQKLPKTNQNQQLYPKYSNSKVRLRRYLVKNK